MRRSGASKKRGRGIGRGGPLAYVPGGFLLTGVLEGVGRLVVAGTIEGEVRVEGEVEVLAGGRVTGPVRASRVRVAGLVDGDVLAAERIEVLGEGRVNGRMEAPRVRRDASVASSPASSEAVPAPAGEPPRQFPRPSSRRQAPSHASVDAPPPASDSDTAGSSSDARFDPLPPLAMPRVGRARAKARRLGG